MPDWALYAVLGVTGIGTLATAAGLLLALIAAYRAIEAAANRMRHGRRTALLREEAVQQLADPAARFLPCHALVCGHMHTVHHPDAAGVLRCEGCGTPATTAP